MKPIYAILAALAGAVPAAQAANGPRKPPLYFCQPAADIAANVEECEDNDAFIEKGEDCLDKLDAEVDKETASMKALFSPDAVSRQAAKFQSSNQDYGQSSASLAYLIALNELAIQEMDQYVGALVLPEDSDETDVNGGDPQRYVMTVNCYGETTRSIRSLQNDFADRLNQLKAAKKAADALAAATASGRKSLDAGSDGAGKAVNGRERGGSLPKGSQPHQGSDITGVQQDQDKQQKK